MLSINLVNYVTKRGIFRTNTFSNMMLKFLSPKRELFLRLPPVCQNGGSGYFLIKALIQSKLSSNRSRKIPHRKTIEVNNKENANFNTQNERPKFNRFFISILGISGLGLFAKMKYEEFKNTITLQEFVNLYLSKGYVEKIQVNHERGKAYLKENMNVNNSNANIIYFSIGDISSFENKIKEVQNSMGINTLNFVPIEYSHLISLRKVVNDLLPTAIGITIAILLLRTFSKSISNSASDRLIKSNYSSFSQVKNINKNVKFSDIAGMKEAKQEIYELVEFLKDPKKFQDLGAKIPKGALLVGPPGTGKTLLAKAVAGEANVPFFYISGSDFIEIFVGMGASRVRELFSQARKLSPSIVFIDEIDAVGRKRARGGGFAASSNDERESTLNQILVEMDGFTENNGVIVLAGTNRSDVLDPALTRPGRFDRIINIERPTLEERKEIFKIYLDPLKLDEKVSRDELIKYLACLSPGFVGSEIKNLCNEAAIHAARRGSNSGVELIDFDKASDRIIGGVKKLDGYLSPKEKKIVSLHESGHAIAGWYLKHAEPVLKVSIVPRTGGALGFAQMVPNELRLLSKEALLDKIAVLLAGRASEELYSESITTGAYDDLQKATMIANSIITLYGMDPQIGLTTFNSNMNIDESSNSNNGGNYSLYKPYSEATSQTIDTRIQKIIHDQYSRVKELLISKKEQVHKLSDLLLNKETVTNVDITECIGPMPSKSI
ncbi:AFG1 ATPase family AAA ATPase [Cryptosporidium ubiquitum]|uniref:AFG1 ATPase family AAA ATPase n=1 Tax=Cryptosporidium ubiquitum TaxID=857276 RepID=A0A1J4MKI7_9CRYT|nr:AFG1 ATPase family AAA ATPase [Cryptosporidium ubiquitum]OII74778.1 AFG1 ATPase family AAA ATPase [Cryptosporidium ubiquitum]